MPSKKKRKRDRKGKNKADDSAHLEADQADESLTVAQKAQKVKKAMEEYNALDHEDMVSLPRDIGAEGIADLVDRRHANPVQIH